MQTIIQTPRVTIREFSAEEEDTYLNHFTDELVIQYIPKRSRDERINIFRKALEQYSTSKTAGIWGMFDKNNDDFIGSCLLRPFDNNTKVMELGYSLERKYWGMGIATEMAAAMISLGFSDQNVSEIIAVTDLENTGSQRVLEKAGLKQVDNLIRGGEELACFRLSRHT
jgi:[ribosomal protein S5]-alanine N-acetyltransferase